LLESTPSTEREQTTTTKKKKEQTETNHLKTRTRNLVFEERKKERKRETRIERRKMTEATLSFRCVRASKELQCNTSAGIDPTRLSLRGGFEMSATNTKRFSLEKLSLNLNRRKFAVTRKRAAMSKKATALAEPPRVEVAGTEAAAEKESKSKSKAKPMSDTVAGALARAASQSTIHPLDTVKVQMQAGTFGQGLGSGGVSKFGSLVPPSGASKIIPGIASLYRGVFGAASGAGIAIGAYFAIYSTTTRLLDNHVKPRFKNIPPGAIAFTAGAIAAAGGSFVKVPLAVCIRSVQAGVYPNVVKASKSIVKAAGPRGLFTGFLPTFLEDVPDMAVKFACYETLRSMHKKFNKGVPSTAQEDLFMGGFSGSVAAAATTPLDVIKTRMMCSAASSPSVMGACRSVWAEGQGMRAFFTGIGPRAISNGVNTAVFFAFFEAIKTIIEERGQRKASSRGPRSVSPAASSSSGNADTGIEFSSDSFAIEENSVAPCMGASMSQTAVTQHLENKNY